MIDIIEKQTNQEDSKEICRNCRYMAWMIGIGQGLRCCYEFNNSVEIPSAEHTCDKFKPKQ